MHNGQCRELSREREIAQHAWRNKVRISHAELLSKHVSVKLLFPGKGNQRSVDVIMHLYSRSDSISIPEELLARMQEIYLGKPLVLLFKGISLGGEERSVLQQMVPLALAPLSPWPSASFQVPLVGVLEELIVLS